MASTYAPVDAYNYVLRMIKNMPFTDVRVQCLDDTLKTMWEAAPWTFTIGTFPPKTLVADQQDYSVAIPADFRKLQYAYITDETGATQRSSIEIVSNIQAGGPPGQVSAVSVIGAAGTTGNLRTYPTWGQIRNGATLTLISAYKKTCPKITAGNVSTPGVQIFDDDWFWVFNSGVLYYAYLYGDDQRAGGASVNSEGKYQYTGQLATFHANLDWMKEREPLLNFTGRLIQEPKQK